MNGLKWDEKSSEVLWHGVKGRKSTSGGTKLLNKDFTKREMIRIWGTAQSIRQGRLCTHIHFRQGRPCTHVHPKRRTSRIVPPLPPVPVGLPIPLGPLWIRCKQSRTDDKDSEVSSPPLDGNRSEERCDRCFIACQRCCSHFRCDKRKCDNRMKTDESSQR